MTSIQVPDPCDHDVAGSSVKTTCLTRRASAGQVSANRPIEAGESSMRFSDLAKSTAVHVAVAFLAMGGWTLWANAGHGLAAAWIPALVQGTISGTITLVLKRALEAMVSRLRGPAAYVL